MTRRVRKSPTDDAFVPGPAFDPSRTPPARVQNVNATDLRAAVTSACHVMGQIFNPDDNGRPYMYTRIWPDGWLGFSPWHGAIQMSGRHLDALLAAEHAFDLPALDPVIAAHTKAAFFSLSAGPLPGNHRDPGGPLVEVDEHSIREALHGLHALVRYRNSDQAHTAAEALIRDVQRLWGRNEDWDEQAIEHTYGLPMVVRPTFVEGVGRAIGPLVKFHETTRSPEALSLAQHLADHATTHAFLADGKYDAERLGAHCHSTTCTLSGLARLADLTGDQHLLNRTRQFYDHGLPTIRDEVGWVRERHHRESAGFHPEQGEMNNVGDIIETAVILGRHFGDSYYQDAERYLRCQLLPSQVRDLSFMEEVAGGDERRDLQTRLLGVFGFSAVYGHLPKGKHEAAPSLDIVGGATASLCAAQQAIAPTVNGATHINMLFDYESDDICIESPYTGPVLRITPKTAGDIHVRIPTWADIDTITVNSHPAQPLVRNNRLILFEPQIGQPIEIGLPLPDMHVQIHHDEHVIEAELRGDSMLAMDDLGAGLAYFPPTHNA